jgi:hypothetical protein
MIWLTLTFVLGLLLTAEHPSPKSNKVVTLSLLCSDNLSVIHSSLHGHSKVDLQAYKTGSHKECGIYTGDFMRSGEAYDVHCRV